MDSDAGCVGYFIGDATDIRTRYTIVFFFHSSFFFVYRIIPFVPTKSSNYFRHRNLSSHFISICDSSHLKISNVNDLKAREREQVKEHKMRA